MGTLKADFSPAFTRDLKRMAKRNWRKEDLSNVISLILANDAESLEILRQRHRMHTLKGEWKNSRECHVANAGDWLLIWSDDGTTAYFQRTGTHEELFR